MLTVVRRRHRFLRYNKPPNSPLTHIPSGLMMRALLLRYAGRVLRQRGRVLSVYAIFECSESFRQVMSSSIEPCTCICRCESEVGEERIVEQCSGPHTCMSSKFNNKYSD